MDPFSPIFMDLESFIITHNTFAPIEFYDENETIEYTILKDVYKFTIVFPDKVREYITHDDNSIENIIYMLSTDMDANDINIVKIKSGTTLIYKFNPLGSSTIHNTQNRFYDNEPRRGRENRSPRRLRFGKKVKRVKKVFSIKNLIKDLKKLIKI